MRPSGLAYLAGEAPDDMPVRQAPSSARAMLVAASLRFFVVTLDAVVANVALPTIGHGLLPMWPTCADSTPLREINRHSPSHLRLGRC